MTSQENMEQRAAENKLEVSNDKNLSLLLNPSFRDLVLSQMTVRDQFRMKQTSKFMKNHLNTIIRIGDVVIGYKNHRERITEDFRLIEQQAKDAIEEIERTRNFSRDDAIRTYENILATATMMSEKFKLSKTQMENFLSDRGLSPSLFEFYFKY